MDDLPLLIDLHLGAERQGPGSPACTRRAIELAGLRERRALRIADVGCGTGASTLVLARELDARITAIDLLPEFLAALRERAAAAGLTDRIATVTATMASLPFADASFDVVWSEGAIYHVGFADGARRWRRLLVPGGILAVTELTWLTDRRPAALASYWAERYAEVGTASSKLAVLEGSGYRPLGYFVLPQDCWLDGYYGPMRDRFAAFVARNGSSDAARAVVRAEEAEIALYERYRSFVGYGFYVAQRT